MKRFLTAVLLTSCLAAAVALAGGPTAKLPFSPASKADVSADPPALPLAGDLPGRSGSRSLDDVVYSEDFESIVSGDLPSGWRRIDQDGGFCNQWNRNSLFEVFNYGRENARSGTRIAMVHYNDGGLPNNDWLILPQITAGAGLNLHYYAASQDPAFLESYEIRVSTTGFAPEDFTTVIETVNDAPVQWTRHIVDLAAFADQSIYIALHCTSSNRFVLKFDDFEINTDAIGPTGSFAGVIRWAVDETHFRPITDADVAVTVDGLGYQTICLDDGSYRFNFIPAGVHSISINAGVHYELGTLANINVNVGAVTDSANLVLQRQDTLTRTYPALGLPRAVLDFDTTSWPISFPLNFTVLDLNVRVNIEHSWIGDLDVWLRAPDGRTVQLYQHNLNIWGDNIEDVMFDDEATDYIFFTSPPYSGTLRPANPLNIFDSAPAEGSWTLLVYDNHAEDIGSIVSWAVQVIAVPGDDINGVDDDPTVARGFDFAGNYPNPFNASTDFAFELANPGNIALRIYNLAGQQVATLVDGAMAAGAHIVHFDASELTSGLYFAQLSANGTTVTRKVVLLK
ncbi:choice-of-anchor J domain-containing protein [candidate division KSB1 bacterium]|nr:choice-of-anchor J domain-containing protein [candidate division KSB1 bacterium]